MRTTPHQLHLNPQGRHEDENGILRAQTAQQMYDAERAAALRYLDQIRALLEADQPEGMHADYDDAGRLDTVNAHLSDAFGALGGYDS